ncbi:MAG: DNA-directed RNA polymerase subunit A' [Candidatus Bathyarchaeota archaeon]
MSFEVDEEVTKVISKIKFGTLSPQELRKLSVVEVTEADTYDEDGAPIVSGLMDDRLGTLEPRARCKTCGNVAAKCAGHFGHIELATPVIQIGFAKLIYEFLSLFCSECGRILVPDKRIEEAKAKIEKAKQEIGIEPLKIYAEVKHEAKSNTRCPHCMKTQSPIEFSKPTTFYEVTDEGTRPLDPSTIRGRLELIHDEDLPLLGYDPKVAKPEWMVLQVLLVPPICVRPSIVLESGIRSEDDLTHKLVDIIRISRRLREYAIEGGAPPLIFHELSDLLQYHTTTYFDNETSGIPPARHRSGRALRTVSQRLKGKEGRFRSNLSGKRVDFSARTVVSPDPNLSIDEVGVPTEIAMHLTYPEVVTEWNIKEMRKLVENGPFSYPGALYVIRPDNKRIRLEFVTERSKIAESLQPHFLIERHLRDGDIVIFNRQPSLHRMSMMAHSVKVLPYKTFRLHLCVCPAYNADFDGDEMYLHVPQTEEAITESKILMQVQDQILSPRYGGPIIGAIRDFITGAFLLTRKSTFLRKDEVCNLLTSIGYKGDLPEPTLTRKEPLWSGKDIFSLLLPKELNYVMKASTCSTHTPCDLAKCKHDAYVVVKNGKLKCGVIDKNAIGAEKSESILHRIIKEYGTEVGKNFLNSLCRLVTSFLAMKGFSYSVDELDTSLEVKKTINKRTTEAKNRINALTKQLQDGTLPRLPGQTLDESFEIYAMNELARARDDAGALANKYFGIDNSGTIMTKSGARGSSLNIGQMTACVGQQSVRGKRIIRGYSDRALSIFEPGDPSPEARGFVYASYRDGLSPTEFFFHSMGGREGLVDTAVRTQQSGYMQRRLVNALQDIRIEYDETVRTATGQIVQFRYGEDAVDPAKSDHGRAVNIERLIDRVRLSTGEGRVAPVKYANDKLKNAKSQITPLLIEELTRNISKSKLSKTAIDEVISATVHDYQVAKIEPGESAGVVAAQSIGEPGTQMTLRTFHFAGVKERNVTLGLPRIIEIVDARRNPSTPIMNVYLTASFRKSKKDAAKIAKELVYTTVNEVSSEIILNQATASIIIRLGKQMMVGRDITVSQLKSALKIPDCVVSIHGYNVIVTPKDIKKLPKILDKIPSIHIKGVAGINRALITLENGEWIIQTDGSNLAKVIVTPGVDPVRTTTNNIQEIGSTLGIEAARNAIIKEMRNVLSEQGLDVDIRHIMLVADMMTCSGNVLQIGRHGISKEKASVLARAAFEITIPSLIDAAVRGLEDTLSGVTENVICGQMIPVGTGTIDLFMTPISTPK